jgi:hypothetical protein
VKVRLLGAFEGLFAGQAYLHRDSSLGDSIAVEVYEDLYELARSPKLIASVDETRRGLGPRNKAVTLQRMRRGDGTLGELVDPAHARRFPGYALARGTVANIDCGVEVKILNKAMIKQIDRVVGDLTKQVRNWKDVSGNVISIALVGINHADYTVGYEGDRAYRTDGRDHKHPFQEAAATERHIIERVVNLGIYDEVVLLRYKARNEDPFAFEWVNYDATRQAYRAALIRLSNVMEARLIS